MPRHSMGHSPVGPVAAEHVTKQTCPRGRGTPRRHRTTASSPTSPDPARPCQDAVCWRRGQRRGRRAEPGQDEAPGRAAAGPGRRRRIPGGRARYRRWATNSGAAVRPPPGDPGGQYGVGPVNPGRARCLRGTGPDQPPQPDPRPQPGGPQAAVGRGGSGASKGRRAVLGRARSVEASPACLAPVAGLGLVPTNWRTGLRSDAGAPFTVGPARRGSLLIRGGRSRLRPSSFEVAELGPWPAGGG